MSCTWATMWQDEPDDLAMVPSGRHPWLTEAEDAVLAGLTLFEGGNRLMVIARARREGVKTRVYWVSTAGVVAYRVKKA